MAKPSRAEKARRLRDAALRYVRTHGKPGTSDGRVKVSFLEAKVGDYTMLLTTPFSGIPEPSEEMKYLASRLNQEDRVQNAPPWGLDIWARRPRGKVLNVGWQKEEGPLAITSFRRGDWEDELLGLLD